MRLWSIHPKYLDSKGIVALWREALLAQKVLQGKTKGYKNHPQLERFKSTADPEASIGAYLQIIFDESIRRGYSFSEEKIRCQDKVKKISVTEGQVKYEWRHFLRKMKARSPTIFESVRKIPKPDHHPLFRIKPGKPEDWEKGVGLTRYKAQTNSKIF